MKLVLRPARVTDFDFAFRLRSDPETRQNSLFQGEIDPRGYQTWFARAIMIRCPDYYVASIEGTDVALGALVPHDSDMELNIMVAPEHRRKGIGTKLVEALTQLAPPGKPLLAQVRPDNTASMKAFLRNGFTVETIRLVRYAS